MSVYIEYVIIDNFAITYVIGLLSYKSLRTRVSVLRNLVAASVGTVCAVVYPLMRLSALWLLLIKIGVLIILSLILFYKKSRLALSAAVFLGITLLLGGVFFALGYVVYGDVVSALTLPVFEFPIGLVLAVMLCVYIFFRRLVLRFHKNRQAKAEIYKVEILALGKKIVADGFYDTGNRIFDSQTGLPVVVLCFKLAADLIGNEAIINLLVGKSELSYKGARYIEYFPFGGAGQKLWLLRPTKFLLYFDEDKNKNIEIDVMLGLSVHSFKDAVDYGLIFGPAAAAKIPKAS